MLCGFTDIFALLSSLRGVSPRLLHNAPPQGTSKNVSEGCLS